MNKIISILITAAVLASPALAGNEEQNSFFDNLGLALGLIRNEITATSAPGVNNINTQFEVNAKYDTDIKWELDGVEVGHNYNVRKSIYRISQTDLSKLKSGNNIVEYKAGKDPKTQKMRHQVIARIDKEVKSWIVTEK